MELALLLFVSNMDTCSIKMETKILYQFSYKPMEKLHFHFNESFIYYTYNFNPYRDLCSLNFDIMLKNYFNSQNLNPQNLNS
jgi:hypothetical protein